MSQRLSRKSKKNQVEEIHVATGGLVARQDAHKRTSPHALTPAHKTTGNLPVEKIGGVAKASPAFKEVPPSDLKNPEDQKKALAENTVETKKTEDKQ